MAGYGLQTTRSRWQHNNKQFSTFDRDNDESHFRNCAGDHGGGWWYNHCYGVLLTGRYNAYYRWRDNIGGERIDLSESVMMIRRRQWIMRRWTGSRSLLLYPLLAPYPNSPHPIRIELWAICSARKLPFFPPSLPLFFLLPPHLLLSAYPNISPPTHSSIFLLPCPPLNYELSVSIMNLLRMWIGYAY